MISKRHQYKNKDLYITEIILNSTTITPRIYKEGCDLRINLREIGSRIRLKSGIYSIDPHLKLVMRMS